MTFEQFDEYLSDIYSEAMEEIEHDYTPEISSIINYNLVKHGGKMISGEAAVRLWNNLNSDKLEIDYI